jgi:formate hydrogenlyase subunit 3/multisubunit Na+/H+ antiporter MnhD subunit
MMPALLTPFIGAILCYIVGRKSERARDAIALTTSLMTFIFALLCRDSVDGPSYLMALITSFVWVVVVLYSLEYMKYEHKRNRFYLFLILSLGADLGVLFASDLLVLYLFFELLTLFSSVLVLHEESEEAIEAFKTYLYLGIAGGLSLLGGIILFYNVTGSLALRPALTELERAGWVRYLMAAMMMAGFGVKAGMFPLHVWLPKAHPAAPTPASALLSGIMVKVGIYGIMRTLLLFSPFSTTGATIGRCLLWIGLITMLVGWVLALMQDHIKRLLAYSTISQIGYIVVGIGCMGLLGAGGALGMAGALYHVLNHAIYKSALFMIAGAIIYKTGETNMSRLGGLSRDMPVLTALTMVAFLGIIAFPGFNGFASETLLHHALAEASEVMGTVDLRAALLLFTINAGGTFAYYLKFIGFTFFGKSRRGREAEEPPRLMLAAIGTLAFFVLFIGVFPELPLRALVIPALEGGHFEHVAFFTPENITNALISLLMGALIFYISLRSRLIYNRYPEALGTDHIYSRIARSFMWLCRAPVSSFASAIERTYYASGSDFVRLVSCLVLAERRADLAYRRFGEDTVRNLETLRKTEEGVFEEHRRIEERAARDLEAIRKLEECRNPLIKFAIRTRLAIGRAIGEWTTLAVFLIVLMLSVYLAIFFLRVL